MKKWGMDTGFLGNAVALLVLGMVSGAIAVNAMAETDADRIGILSVYFLRQYKYLEINMAELFWYIMGKRLKWVFLIWLCGFTAAGLPCMAVYVLWIGFSGGILMGISVLKLGIVGILFAFAAVFPQVLVYVPAWTYFMHGIYRRFGGRMHTGAGSGLGRYILLLAGASLLTVFGILVESGLNPWIVKQILRLI